MTPSERRWSALIDLITVGGVIGVLCLLAACQRAGDNPSQPRGGTAERCKAATMPESGCPPPGSIGTATEAVPVFTDPDTGCQYLGYTGHGLTPRMQKHIRNSDGSPYETQVGCR